MHLYSSNTSFLFKQLNLSDTHIFEIEPPGENIPSPFSNPKSFEKVCITSFSIKVNTGPTSNVYLKVNKNMCVFLHNCKDNNCNINLLTGVQSICDPTTGQPIWIYGTKQLIMKLTMISFHRILNNGFANFPYVIIICHAVRCYFKVQNFLWHEN